jgi:phage-related minor tail protein
VADKEAKLAIVLRLVDQASAGVDAVNKHINRFTAPLREIGERIKGIAEKAGLPEVVEGFKGVGGAVQNLVGKLLIVGGVAGAAVLGVKSLVDEFATLGNTANRLGVNVDFLAAMRYAAKESGASMEQLDQGLTTFGENLGQARAGTGRMVKFLNTVSPALLTQLKAAKDNEAAFRLLADAMAKVTDPAKRLALAQKTVGDAALAPLLARGSKGLLELQGSYAGLAGSQEGAAAGAKSVEESMVDLGAATDGVKAVLIAGLAPALKVIVDKLSAWLVDHREDIKQWAADIGEKLPKAVQDVVTWLGKAYDKVMAVVGIMGGFGNVALVVAGILIGPLLTSIISLGVALLTTPVGWVLLAIAAIAAGAYELISHWDAVAGFFEDLWAKYGQSIKGALAIFAPWVLVLIAAVKLIIKHWEPIKAFFAALWDGITAAFSTAWDVISAIVDKIAGAVKKVIGVVGSVTSAIGGAVDWLNPFSDDSPSGKSAPRIIDAGTLNAAAGAAAPAPTETRVKVDFANAPRGTRVTADPQSTGDIDLSVGYQMIGLGGG